MRTNILLAVSWLPLIPCGGSGQVPCSPCHLFEAFHNVIDFVLYGVTGPIAAFLVVVAGGMMLLNNGDPKRWGKGKTLLQNTLIGVSIILLSWVFTNFLIKTLAQGNAYDGWNEFTCPAGLSNIVNIQTTFPSVSPPPPIATSEVFAAQQDICSVPEMLSLANNTPNSNGQNAPVLTKMMACLESDPIVAALFDPTPSQHGTYDQSHPTCNRTRGRGVCEPDKKCSHGTDRRVPSCHYGGKTGTEGALAVDYNARSGVSVTYVIATRRIVASESDPACKTAPVPPATEGSPGLCRTVTGEAGLFDELYRVSQLRSCPTKFVFYEPVKTSSGAVLYHTHISAQGCDADGSGPSGLRAPSVP